jgi:hypothetical protein
MAHANGLRFCNIAKSLVKRAFAHGTTSAIYRVPPNAVTYRKVTTMFTYAMVIDNGWQAPKVRATCTEVHAAYTAMRSAQRYSDLHWAMVARRSNLRAAHRRYLRRRGMPLAPLAAASKYRTKGRKVA